MAVVVADDASIRTDKNEPDYPTLEKIGAKLTEGFDKTGRKIEPVTELGKDANGKTDTNGRAAAVDTGAAAGPAGAAPAGAAANGGVDDDLDTAPEPRTRADWDNYKAKHKERLSKAQKEWSEKVTKAESALAEHQAKVKDLESKLEKSATPNPALEAKIEEMNKVIDDLQGRLYEADVEKLPAFQEVFENKRGQAMAQAKKILGEEAYGEFEKALKLSDEQRDTKIEELSENLSRMGQNRLGAVINQLEALKSERQTEIERSKNQRTERQAEAAARQQKALGDRMKAFDAMIAELQDKEKGNVLLQPRDNDPAWNEAIQKTVSTAKALIFGDGKGKFVPQDQAMKGAIHAALYPRLLESYHGYLASTEAEKKRLESQVKDLSRAQPGVGAGAGSGAPTGGGDAPFDHGGDPEKLLKHMVGQAVKDVKSSDVEQLRNRYR